MNLNAANFFLAIDRQIIAIKFNLLQYSRNNPHGALTLVNKFDTILVDFH